VHELAFGLKRAHLCAVAEGKWNLKKCEISPARFDALMVVLRAGGKCLQREIWQRLGLARSTICKMLDAMEEKGLVWRMRSDVDGRQVVVVLTRGGLDRMVVAIDELVLGDSVRRRWDRMHKEGRAFVLRAIDTVRTITRRLYDTSDHHYRTDDLDEKDDAKAYLFVADVRSEIERLAYLRDQARPPHPPEPSEPPERDPLTDPPPSTGDLYDDERSLADRLWWKDDEEHWTDEDIDALRYDRYGITACLERWAAGAAEASGAKRQARLDAAVRTSATPDRAGGRTSEGRTRGTDPGSPGSAAARPR